MNNTLRGIFAIRGPNRPNMIGMSIVRVVAIEGNPLHIQDIDILNETPLSDIKPHTPEVDCRLDVKTSWLTERGKRFHQQRAT